MSNPFRGAPGETVNISVTTATGRAQISGFAQLGEYRVCNDGTSTVYFREGDGTVTAGLTVDMRIPAGAIEVLTFGSTHVAAITASGTSTLSITPGDGI